MRHLGVHPGVNLSDKHNCPLLTRALKRYRLAFGIKQEASNGKRMGVKEKVLERMEVSST